MQSVPGDVALRVALQTAVAALKPVKPCDVPLWLKCDLRRFFGWIGTPPQSDASATGEGVPHVTRVACVTIFGDMNTFCIGLVPQSE